jgi:hypothetical protein
MRLCLLYFCGVHGQERKLMTPDKRREYYRKWVEKNKESIREKRRIYDLSYKRPPRKYKTRAEMSPERAERKRAYMRRYYAAHHDQEKARAKKHWHTVGKFQKEENAATRRKHRYGLTPEAYKELFDSQGGICAICNARHAQDIDHCRETGNVRGLLCRACNLGLGMFGETIDGLERAIAYLKRTSG